MGLARSTTASLFWRRFSAASSSELFPIRFLVLSRLSKCGRERDEWDSCLRARDGAFVPVLDEALVLDEEPTASHGRSDRARAHGGDGGDPEAICSCSTVLLSRAHLVVLPIYRFDELSIYGEISPSLQRLRAPLALLDDTSRSPLEQVARTSLGAVSFFRHGSAVCRGYRGHTSMAW